MSTSLSHHSSGNDDVGERLHQQRLLADIYELVTKPYPKIAFYPSEDSIEYACLVLTPNNYPPLHLTVYFPATYPVQPPNIRMNSSIQHPNIFGEYICASILNRSDEYTPAYTFKGIAIQLLSFFDSENLQQVTGTVSGLAAYRDLTSQYVKDTYTCTECNFGLSGKPPQIRKHYTPKSFDARVGQDLEQWPAIAGSSSSSIHLSGSQSRPHGVIKSIREKQPRELRASLGNSVNSKQHSLKINSLPNELILMIIEHLEDFEHLTNFARAWPRVSELVRDFDVIRQRELQCFCLKENYRSTKLGVGVTVNRGQVSSEFDLISKDAFTHMNVRQSIQCIPFHHWLPVPISRQHWSWVRQETRESLSRLASQLKSSRPSPSAPSSLSSSPPDSTLYAQAIFTFMNDIVVRLNQATEKLYDDDSNKSTLRHASEKAIESYFHLFHLLVCLATENSDIVHQANKLLREFEAGKRSKTDCPNLGHLLIALLISDVQVTDELIKSIVTEAITRNVVWLLDRKGAGLAELSYMERDTVSAYRLNNTFLGSRTSYRLLMFSELFRRTARPSHEETLSQVRDELFDRYGGPPRGAAAHLAAEVRRLQGIDNFPAFMREMGLKSIPTPANFTRVLRATMHASMKSGYSKWALGQREAMRLRSYKDFDVQLVLEEREWLNGNNRYPSSRHRPVYTFFPQTQARRKPETGRRGQYCCNDPTHLLTSPNWTICPNSGRPI